MAANRQRGEQDIEGSATKEQRKKKQGVGKRILSVLKWSAIFLFVGALIFAIALCFKVAKVKEEAVEMVYAKGSEVFKQDLTTLVYDKNGEIIATLSAEKEAYYTQFENIPQLIVEIFLVTEDRKFYEHNGVDFKSVVRAFIANIENEEIVQGASTITQQLAKNIYLSSEVTINRKLKEIFIAYELEELYSKDEIMEFYINNIYFANGMYGIGSASKGYFGKELNELSLSQMCFICAIPNSPESYNPITNFENTISRRNRILKQLVDEGKITKDDYEKAITEEITLVSTPQTKNNYVETFVRYCATRELMVQRGFEFKYNFGTDSEKELYTEEYNRVYGECNALLFTGGYRIYTSIDMQKQNELQQTLNNKLSVDSTVNADGIYNLQGSAVCIDNESGYVVAIVGGREEEYNGYSLNRAYQSFRQPGSSIKPILVYAPLFETGYTPESIVLDEPISGGPVNSPNVYSGQISIRTAIALSKNTIAWKMFENMGMIKNISYLLNMRFSHIVSSDYVPAMSIGGMTYGVSTLEMASAYSTMENQGGYRIATCIEKIDDSFGKNIVNNGKIQLNQSIIYNEETTVMITDVLKDVLVWGTGTSYQVQNAICAAKTGTTNDNKDSWLVGYSKYYTTAVWVGYDLPKTLDLQAVKSAGYIWKEFMEKIHSGLEVKDFESYEPVQNIVNEVAPQDTPVESTTTVEKESEPETTTKQQSTSNSEEEVTSGQEIVTPQATEIQTYTPRPGGIISGGENDSTQAEETTTPQGGYIYAPDTDDGLYIQTY